jgi:hypothetical protein
MMKGDNEVESISRGNIGLFNYEGRPIFLTRKSGYDNQHATLEG